jgi:hypothetical protein
VANLVPKLAVIASLAVPNELKLAAETLMIVPV